MNAEELMRLDWVCLEDDPTPRQVDWIRSGEVGLYWNKIVTPPYIKPIPLTVEILEKNGLEKDNHGRLYGEYFDEDVNSCLEISVDDKTGEIWWSYNWDEYRIIRLRYVHELQHALRLCGITREIIL